MKQISLDFFRNEIFGQNELWRFAAVFGVLLLSLAVGRIIRYFLERRGAVLQGRKNSEVLGLALTYLAKPVVLLSFAAGFAGGMLFLRIPENVAPAVSLCNRLLFSLSLAYMVYNLVDIIDHYLTRWADTTENRIDDMLVPLVRKSLRITIVIIVVVYIAESVSGKTIGTLVAGLGIGGLAVALAAQDTLKNFFASIVIMVDQPFHIGDWVDIDGKQGTIEEVGFRSTKIRTFEGHLVVMPNSTVANLTIDNVGRRPFIRRWMTINVTYDTPPEKVEEALAILSSIADERAAHFHPDYPTRVRFSELNSHSLDLIFVYYYTPVDFWQFKAFSDEVNMEILKRFNAAGIDFAFPSQTLYLAGDDKRQLAVRQVPADA